PQGQSAAGGRRGLRGHRHGLGQARGSNRPGLREVSGPLFGLRALDDNADDQAAAPQLSFTTNSDGAADGGAANVGTGRVSARRSQTRPAEWRLVAGDKA